MKSKDVNLTVAPPCPLLRLTRAPSRTPDLGLELPHLRLFAVGLVPGRSQARRPTDDRSGNAHVDVHHHHQQVEAARQAQLRQADYVYLPSGLVHLHSRPGAY